MIIIKKKTGKKIKGMITSSSFLFQGVTLYFFR